MVIVLSHIYRRLLVIVLNVDFGVIYFLFVRQVYQMWQVTVMERYIKVKT